MLKTLSIATFMTLTGATLAHADWQRNVQTTGPNGGVWTKNSTGSCYGGSCSSRQTWTGPAGRSWSRQGTTSCRGGVCNGRATWTGQNGRTWTRTRNFRRF